MATAASGAASYCSVAVCLEFYDYRTVADLVSDDGARHTLASLTADVNLNAVLQAASGRVESACFRGNKYLINPTAVPPINDLLTLTGNSQFLLQKLVADLAFGFLFERRPQIDSEPPMSYQLAMKTLDDLESGKLVFGLVENMAAGHSSHYTEGTLDQMGRNTATRRAHRYFGRRYHGQWNQ